MQASLKLLRTAVVVFGGRPAAWQPLSHLASLELPNGYRELFEEIPDFRMDISSTAIREAAWPLICQKK